MDTPNTNRLLRTEPAPSNRPDIGLQQVGFSAIVEQLVMLNETLLGIRDDLRVGGSPLGVALEVEIDNRTIHNENLADRIAFAIETRRP